MTLEDALARAVLQLEAAGIGPARLSAETLMMFALHCDRAHLFAHPERELNTGEQQRFDSAVSERAAGKPVQYITGHQEFWGLDFTVNPSVLIPRPETEHLVEAVLELLREYPRPHPRIVDVGTGSGCIILAIAHSLAAQRANSLAARSEKSKDSPPRNFELHATDISPDALHVAQQNSQQLKLAGHINFRQANLLESETGTFDFILSNPPYVGLNEQDKVQREVREHEPHVAVFAGHHGLDIYRRLIPQAYALLRSGGWLVMEIGYSIEEQVRGLLALHPWAETRTIPDLQGIPRVLMARK